jgi:3-methyladenine DNA glycosylase AlkD
MDHTALFNEIRHYCIDNASAEIVQKYSRYFKEGFDSYGLTQELLMSKVDDILQRPEMNLEQALKVAKLLIPTGKYEETSFALVLTGKYSRDFTHDTFAAIEEWYQLGIINWGHTDHICGELLPPFLLNKLVTLEAFESWRTASNKFQRRSVPVTFIKPLKKGFDPQTLLDFIDPMMLDSERVVHQGLGWFLREVWKLHPELCETFLHKWKNEAARLIFQYATEKMSKEYRQQFRKQKG